MKRLYFKFILALTFSLFLFNAFAEKPRLIYPEVIFPSTSGLGGNFSTYYKRSSVLFSNPALFALTKKHTSITSFNFRADSLAYSALKYIKAKDRETSLLNMLANTSSLCTNAALTGPISFSFIDKNFGFGMFNTTRAIALLPSLSSLFSLVGQDIVITGGYGASVFEKEDHLISLGILMKGFFQVYAYTNSTVFGSAYTIFEKKLKGFPILLQAGFGFDLGFAYKYKDIFTLGFTCKDLYSPVFLSYYENYKDFFESKPNDKAKYKTFIPNLNLGFSIKAISEGYFKNVYSLVFYADLKNILSFIPSIIKPVSFFTSFKIISSIFSNPKIDFPSFSIGFIIFKFILNLKYL